jgi:hypothetical protein
MLCSLAELGWDPERYDEVALLRRVPPGSPLGGYTMWDCWTIVAEPVEPVHIPPPTLAIAQMVPTPT